MKKWKNILDKVTGQLNYILLNIHHI